MSNMPNLTTNEIAVVGAALVVMFITPALLAWTDERRRRRMRHAQEMAASAMTLNAPPASEAESLGVAPAAPPGETWPAPDASAAAVSVDMGVPGSEDLPAADAAMSPAPPPAVPPNLVEAVTPPLELRPLDGPSRHHFQFGDLHQARLPDWPPAAIRLDIDRHRVWQDAQRVWEDYRQAIASAVIWSPYPARSTCLGAAQMDEAHCQLNFLLFPVLWPVSQNQAVAQAVFQIDRNRTEVRGWVDALRSQELTEENRHEIRESGGDLDS